MVYTKHSQKSSDTVDPDKEGNITIMKGALWDDWLGVVRAEKRTYFLKGLVMAGVGTNDVENFISKQESIRFSINGSASGKLMYTTGVVLPV